MQELLAKVELSTHMTAKPQQLKAQLEANLSRKENQKVSEKSQKNLT